MKRNRNKLFLTVFIASLLGTTPFLIGNMKLEEFESVKAEVPYTVTSPIIPESATFAGQTINLGRYDRRERMDRELTSFTYMHSTTMLLIKRANRFFPIIEPILRQNGVPDDFKYLMVIESNVTPFARSSAGAAGLWQFLQTTGRENGLEVNNNIDERYHVAKSTQAACKYLADAYNIYGDWMTVAASYNAGKGRISGELKKQMVQNALDLWLVEETSRYMFRIMAAKMVFEDPQRYGFMLKKEQLYPAIPYTEVTVNTGIADLAQFAQTKGITYAQLKDANPWLRSTSLENKSGRTYKILIPKNEGIFYDPKRTVPHSRAWVID